MSLLFIDGAKVYTPVYTKKLLGLHKGNSVTMTIYQKATLKYKQMIIRYLHNNKVSVMLLLPLH
jgi:hypothetical protein